MVRGRQSRIKNYYAENRLFAVRSILAGVIAAVLLLAVAGRLFFLQVIRHDYYEEVHLLAGELYDLTLDRVFTAGHYASRPPGMPHGPYRTGTGCTMLEIRYRPGG